MRHVLELLLLENPPAVHDLDQHDTFSVHTGWWKCDGEGMIWKVNLYDAFCENPS